MKHITVLLKEGVDALALKSDSVVIDATHGAGGHGMSICEILGPSGVYIGIDADQTALSSSPLQDHKGGPSIHLVQNNFAHLEEVVRSLHISQVDGILADLGWRTDQFTDGGKGFSFSADEPLTMTYGDPEGYTFTAHDIVNEWDEENIADIIYGYGEERQSRKIASAIVAARAVSPIKTARELAQVIESVMPPFYKKAKINPATKTFQALRIAVNDELGVLESFISQASALLAPQGRLAIISFHSLEDRIVKLRFKDLVATGEFSLVVKKPITPSDEELLANPRARSAKLRILEKT
jgi:16S rRNA (cytosine1402-N4)-methyltransferase